MTSSLILSALLSIGFVGEPAKSNTTSEASATKAVRPVQSKPPVTPPTVCDVNRGPVSMECIECYDQCQNTLTADTPEDTITTSAFGRGTKCYSRPKGYSASLVGDAQIYNFLEEWTGIGYFKGPQPGVFPFSSGLSHQVHVRLWFKSVNYTTGGPGPRVSLTDSPVKLYVNYWTVAGETRSIDLLTHGTPVCTVLLTTSNPTESPAVVQSWVVAMPEDVKLVWFSGLVPMLDNETIFMDADITLKSSK